MAHQSTSAFRRFRLPGKRNRFGMSLGAALLLGLLSARPALRAQESANGIEALRPEFYQLIDKNATIEKISGTFEGSIDEGPVWNPKGFLIFSDIYGDKMYQWHPDGPVTVFREPAGYPNGNTYDEQGRLIMCEQKFRRVIRMEKNGHITILADDWGGKKLNCPNDVVVGRDGTIYFTDPWWGFPPGGEQELSFQGVFRIDPHGKLNVEAQDFGLPNGIALSPDEKTLYIGDTRRAVLYALDVAPDGSLSHQRLLADLKSTEKGAVDGMKVDEQGNIWTTGPGGVWVLDKTGAHLGTLRLPGPKSIEIKAFEGQVQTVNNVPANCGWGDRDYKTLYLAAPISIYRVHTKVRGMATYKLR